MSILPEMRRCPKCGGIYSYNPDVGQFSCPNCTKKHMQNATKTLWNKLKKLK